LKIIEAGMASKKKLSHELTEHIARLGHLELTEEEKDKFTNQMNSILENFEQLAEVNVDGVEPTYHAMEITNIFREDKPKPCLSQEEALKNAPITEEGYIKAGKVV
jgi:aspartyl-tRNA(Asn)/glutamyl-tRNA(Gln) amidotransferase subunit C